MDSVRARNVGLYGHYHETTPRLSEFADGATVYHQARAPAIWSLPSHASIFTGLEVPEHRITGEEDKLKPDTSIWETLQDDYGYRTGLFTGNGYIAGEKHGLNRGFEDIGESPTFEDYPFEGTSPSEFYRKHGHPPSSVEYLRYSFGSEYPLQSVGNGFVGKFDGLVERVAPNLQPTYPNRGRELADQFLTWVGRVDEPWAVCMNFGDAHTPYRPEEPHDKWGGSDLQELMKGVDDIEWDFWTGNRPWWQLEALEYLYDGGIHQADHQIGRILDELAAAGTLDETLVVVTSDHGEGFGELDPTRGFRSAGHLHGTSEIHYHVPLVVKYPGQSSREDIDDLVTLSQFPAAVETVLEKRGSPASFIPEGSVVTYATGADIGAASDEKTQFKRERFEGQIMIAYTAADRVEKSIRWGDDEATVEIQDVQQTMKVSETAGEGLTAFDELSDQDVRMEASEEAYDESTQEFLEQMGYV